MDWLCCVSYFFGGMFVANAVPHFVSGVMGRPFPSPFAKPPGEGLSSPVVNVLWGWLNLVVGYLLIVRVGAFHLHSLHQAGAAAAGALVLALMMARHFGRVRQGRAERDV